MYGTAYSATTSLAPLAASAAGTSPWPLLWSGLSDLILAACAAEMEADDSAACPPSENLGDSALRPVSAGQYPVARTATELSSLMTFSTPLTVKAGAGSTLS